MEIAWRHIYISCEFAQIQYPDFESKCLTSDGIYCWNLLYSNNVRGLLRWHSFDFASRSERYVNPNSYIIGVKSHTACTRKLPTIYIFPAFVPVLFSPTVSYLISDLPMVKSYINYNLRCNVSDHKFLFVKRIDWIKYLWMHSLLGAYLPICEYAGEST